jgi:hypothetical protein
MTKPRPQDPALADNEFVNASTIRKIEAQLTGNNVKPYSPTRLYLMNWNNPTMQSLRVLGFKLASRDAKPNIDGLYDGEIGDVEAFLLLNDLRPQTTTPRDGEIFEAAGFRLKVRSDINYLIVWGDLR